MGYFSEEDIRRKEQKKNTIEKKELTREILIRQICTADNSRKKEDLEKLSTEKLKLIKNKIDLLQQKKYLERYGKKTTQRLYEYNDSLEEEDGYLR